MKKNLLTILEGLLWVTVIAVMLGLGAWSGLVWLVSGNLITNQCPKKMKPRISHKKFRDLVIGDQFHFLKELLENPQADLLTKTNQHLYRDPRGKSHLLKNIDAHVYGPLLPS